MVFDKTTDVFDTPKIRYYKLKGDFRRIYLNPRAWNHKYGSRQSVQAYHDLLYYLEVTEEFRGENKALLTEILTDNIHLVFYDLPLPPKYREQLIEYVVAGKPSQEEELCKIKEYLERKKRGNLNAFESRCYDDALNVKVEKSFEIKAKKSLNDGRFAREKEILEIRQKIYSKLNKGQNVFSILKKFKRKVDMFLVNYRAELSYDEGEHWKEKFVITERAVKRHKKEVKSKRHSKENEVKVPSHSRRDETLAPTVKEIFDAVQAQELVIENLPEPPHYDDIEEKLVRLKKFTKRLNVAKNENAIEEETKVTKVKA